MAENNSLPRQNSDLVQNSNPTPTWYNFFRRLLARVDTLENSIVSTSPNPPYPLTGDEELTIVDATTARTLSSGDAGCLIEFTSSSAVTVTVNANDGIPDNAIIYLTQGSSGQVTVVAGAGVTIEYTDTLKTRTQESTIGLKQFQTNKWELFGDVEPLALAKSALIRAPNSNGVPAWVAPTADSQKLKQVSGSLAWATDTASEIVNVPAGNISATNVQSALNELDAEKAALVHTHVSTDITDFNSATRAQTEAELVAGANITITPASSGATRTLTISASGGGGGNSTTVTCSFGASFTDKAQAVVTGQAWVTATSEIVVHALTPSGTDPDEMYLLDFKPVISDLVVGTGFTLTVYSQPEAKGDYDFMCIGV